MLFTAEPVNISLAVSASSATAGVSFNAGTSGLFARDGVLFAVLRGVSGAKPGIAFSLDTGATWSLADTGYALPDATAILADSLGDSIVFAAQNGSEFAVVTFDMATRVYTSTSSTVDVSGVGLIFQGFAGGGLASNGDYYLFVTYVDISDFSAGPLAYYVLSSGVWSARIALDSASSFLETDCVTVRDSAGAVHQFYRHLASNDGVHPFPIQLRHVKPGGSPDMIQSIPAIGTNFRASGAIAWQGALYLSNTKNESLQHAFVSDSDTAPTTWADVEIDSNPLPSISGIGLGKFVADETNGLLYVFYVGPNSNSTSLSLWYSVLSGGVWATPVLAYDIADNPPPDLSVDVTAYIFRSLSVVLMNGAFYAMTDFPAASSNAFILRVGGRVRSYIF